MLVVEREANKFFRVFGFMAGNDSVMKGVEKVLISLDKLIERERFGFVPDDAFSRICR